MDASAQYSAERNQGGEQQAFHGAMMPQAQQGWQVLIWFQHLQYETQNGTTLADGAGER
jgi:hypothetical protein